MNAFGAYAIPILGLKTGVHHYQYTIDRDFFAHFEGSPIETGTVNFDLNFEKRSDMLLLDFTLKGFIGTECDRCTAQINLPIEDERQLIVKYSEQPDDEEDEVVFISRELSHLNIARYLYEFTILALPITNTYACEDDSEPPCNQDILKFLKKDTDDDTPSSIWDALKGLDQ